MRFAGHGREVAAAPRRRRRESLGLALEVAESAAAAAVGAGLLAAVIVLTGRNALWMAVGAGILVGNAVRLFGKDDGIPWGVVGAALTLACCLAGNVLASEAAAARHGGIPLPDVIFGHGPGPASAMMKEALRPVRLASYALAVAIGYAVVREERFDASFHRLADRYRR